MLYGVFRSSNAPASLKQLIALWDDRIPQGFPEQQCSGLIEASATRRGSTRVPARFPEQQCSGLIEAPAPIAWTPPGQQVFRSSNAPASLKPAGPASFSARGRPVFRSSNAPASLKHGRGAARGAPGRCFPEQQCSGLIEASPDHAPVAALTKSAAYSILLASRSQQLPSSEGAPPGAGTSEPTRDGSHTGNVEEAPDDLLNRSGTSTFCASIALGAGCR